jgi:hypothetical protein
VKKVFGVFKVKLFQFFADLQPRKLFETRLMKLRLRPWASTHLKQKKSERKNFTFVNIYSFKEFRLRCVEPVKKFRGVVVVKANM